MKKHVRKREKSGQHRKEDEESSQVTLSFLWPLMSRYVSPEWTLAFVCDCWFNLTFIVA